MSNYSKKIKIERILPELQITTARSGGPGGQNVNKVETKVLINFHVQNSNVLTAWEKELILNHYAQKLTKEGHLKVSASNKSSQLQNKEEALKKLERLLAKAFVFKKVRKPTKPGRGAIEKRIQSKKQNSEKKQWRKKLL